MTPDGLAARLANRCPGLTVETIAELGAGDFCVAYLVNGATVVRVARHAEAAASLRREACLLPSIAPHIDLRIPVPDRSGLDAEPAFATYALLPGSPLTPAQYRRLSGPERDRCVRQVAHFLAQLHATDLGVARACGVDQAAYLRPYDRLLERAQRLINTGSLSSTVRAVVEHALAQPLPSIGRQDATSVLLHGDLSHDHILFDARRHEIVSIIDFGDVTMGDPAWDFVYLYEEYGADFVRACVQAYPTAEHAAFLNVSAGLGASVYAPIRFACRPEASLITLEAER